MSHVGISVSQQSSDQNPGLFVAYKDPYDGKTGAVAGEMSPRDECKETWNLRKFSSKVASRKVFPENNPVVNNSGNVSIIT